MFGAERWATLPKPMPDGKWSLFLNFSYLYGFSTIAFSYFLLFIL